MPPPSARRPRWWPAVLVLLAVAASLAVVWLREAPMTQRRVESTGAVLALGALALLAWALLLSRFALRTRAAILAACIALAALGAGLFEVRGVTGDMVPLLGWRFARAPELPAVEQRGSAVAAPARPVETGPAWPQFLGPGRDATVRDAQLARDWEANPPREVWRRAVGPAWSGFAIAGDAAFTQEQRPEGEAVVCYALATGLVRWVHADAEHYASTIAGDGPRATPAVTPERVVTLGPSGRLNCLERATGAVVWTRDVLTDNEASNLGWGLAGSPLVLDGRVVVSPGGRDERSLVAYDLASGERVWSGGSDRAGYSSPALLTLDGVAQIVAFNGGSLAGHDPETGAQLWTTSWSNRNPNAAQPVPVDASALVVSSGYGVGAARFAIRRTDAGWNVEQEWKSRALKSKFANFVARDGHLYGLDDGVLACVDAATGKRVWKRGRYGHGQLILVDDVLLVTAETGELVLVAAAPDEHVELARVDALDDKTWNSPAFAAPYLVVRNDHEAACYELPLLDAE